MKSLILIVTCVLAASACKDDNVHPELPDATNVDSSGADANVCLLASGTPANCFDQATCVPDSTDDFLNGCTDVGCVAFDNVARLPLYNDGNLPALP